MRDPKHQRVCKLSYGLDSLAYVDHLCIQRQKKIEESKTTGKFYSSTFAVITFILKYLLYHKDDSVWIEVLIELLDLHIVYKIMKIFKVVAASEETPACIWSFPWRSLRSVVFSISSASSPRIIVVTLTMWLTTGAPIASTSSSLRIIAYLPLFSWIGVP